MLETLLNSWDRQTGMIAAIADLVTEDLRKVKTDPEGWTLDYHLAHIHETRYYWLSHLGKPYVEGVGDVLREDNGEWLVIDNLAEINNQLQISAAAVRKALAEQFDLGTTTIGPYDHPVLFLQHMIWHEGYHFGLIRLGLRLAGAEPTEEWEDEHVWGRWRNYG